MKIVRGGGGGSFRGLLMSWASLPRIEVINSGVNTVFCERRHNANLRFCQINAKFQDTPVPWCLNCSRLWFRQVVIQTHRPSISSSSFHVKFRSTPLRKPHSPFSTSPKFTHIHVPLSRLLPLNICNPILPLHQILRHQRHHFLQFLLLEPFLSLLNNKTQLNTRPWNLIDNPCNFRT